jgi:hypothetical protein
MAITASLAVISNSAPTSGQRVDFALTITNSGAAAVTLNIIQPFLTQGTSIFSAAISEIRTNFNSGNTSVPAGGSLVVNFSAVPFLPARAPYPTPPASPSQVSGFCTVLASDGSYATSNTVNANVFPVTEPTTPPPPAGMVSGQSNFNTAILVASQQVQP